MARSLRRSAILFFCAAFAFAQEGASRGVAYDPAARLTGLKSYSWFADPRRAMPAGNAVVDGEFIDRTVRAAVNARLGRKGFTKVQTDANFSVAYALSDAGGASQNKWELPSNWVIDKPLLQAGTATQKEPNPAFVPDSGTKYQRRSVLVLEIRDDRGALVWRGARTHATGTNPDDLARGIDHAVAKLLANFPPKARAHGKGLAAPPAGEHS